MKPDLISLSPMTARAMAAMAEHFTVHAAPESGREAFLAGFADRARYVQTTGLGPQVSAAVMSALPRLEMIGVMAVGVDFVDLAEARRRSIAVSNTPDVLNDDVADLAIALMIMAARQLPAAERFVRTGSWLKGPMPLTRKVSGKRLGILGLGRIGKAIARRAEPFGMSIAYHGRQRQADMPYRYFDNLVAMAREVDFLVVIVPGGAGTRHLVTAEVMRALGPQGILVNVARGSVVDEDALVACLAAGELGGAGLDVFAAEPKVPERLLAMDNVVVLPHIGSGTIETRDDMGLLVVRNLVAHLTGKPLPTRVA